ncbi:MAG: MltA-interacting MipA family protein [Thermodesulfobacteriota bacterium]
MKKITLHGLLILILALVGTGSGYAADATFGGDFNSAYVWRGMTFNDGAVFQPSLDVSHKGFGLNVWGNLDIDDYDNTLNSGKFSEVDLTLSYSFNIEKLSAAVGWIEYLFPQGAEGTREVYVSLAMDVYKGLTAGLNLYYDVENVGDYFTAASLGYSLPVGANFTLDLKALAGYCGEDFAVAYGGTDGGFHDYTFSMTGTYTLIQNLNIKAYLNYTGSLDDDVLPKKRNGGYQDTDLYGGIGVYYSF